MEFDPVLTVNAAPPPETLTIEKLETLTREGQKQIDDLNDELVYTLMAAGFRVIISEAIPHGMVALLPGNFKGSFRRALEKLRSGDRRFGLLINGLA